MKQKLFGKSSEFFRRLAPSKQYGLTIFSIVLITLSWLLTYYLKTETQIHIYQQEIQNLKQQRQMLTKARTEIKKLKHSVNFLKNTLNKLTKTNQNPHSQKEQITTIADIANKSGLKLQSCCAENKKIKDWFSKQNVAYSTIGTISQINRFIKMLQANDQTTKCKQLTLNKEANSMAKFNCTLQLLNFSKPITN